MTIEALLRQNPVIPVVTIDDPADAVPLATALLEGGVTIIEVTLRSDAALAAIREIRSSLPGMTVGCGTIRGPADLEAAIDASAHFGVSPGTPRALLEFAVQCGLPFLPAASTPSEVMTLLQAGFNCIKFFPAAAMGGIAALSALAGPLPDALFCPSGGVNAENYRDYLRLDNVVSVSGSWIASSKAIKGKDWRSVTDAAASLSRTP